MSIDKIDDLTSALKDTRVSPSGISFANKSLKVNSEEDAQQIVEAINKCTDLQFLNLEGNTFGVDACKVIGNSLEKHPEFKRALWKDMFTGRMKSEIPQALEHLGKGLVIAGARLTELDLSDNAFGPIGVEGLAALIRSSSCYALEELRLNNNGLGISGGKLLANALIDCYNSSKEAGKTLSLKVFIAGRNRLENEGAIALSSVFKMIGTLEEIAMPQNGIYFHGISALADSFIHNRNLQILNLNDNTIGFKGAASIAKVLSNLQKLKEINFGDCLLKTQGAIALAEGLKNGHSDLEEINLGHNEIRIAGGIELVKAMKNKSKLKLLNLNGNQFGDGGITKIKNNLKDIGKLNTLGSFSEDEAEDSNEDEEDVDDEPHSDSDDVHPSFQADIPSGVTKSIDEFLENPSAENFLALGSTRNEIIVKKAIGKEMELKTFLPILMKVSQLTETAKSLEIGQKAFQCTEELYKNLFHWAENSNLSSVTNNALLEYTGLIKSEDKKLNPVWDQKNCLRALLKILEKPFVPQDTKILLRFFILSQAKLT